MHACYFTFCLWKHQNVLYDLVKKGDRIAQLICERVFIPELQEVEVSHKIY